MATSSYIQISDYALLEYIYSNDTITTAKAKPLRLYNNYSDEYQFLNSSQAVDITGNVLDNCVVRLGTDSTQWGYLTMNNSTPLVQIDPNFTLSDMTSKMGSSINYDTVRLHLLSGYDFPGLDGIILNIGWGEWDINGDVGRNFTPASQVYVKGGEDRINYSIVPLFLGDRFYDRYIEFSLPSLANVNFDFWNSPSSPVTLGYNYTFDNVGFSQTSQINATLYEINSTSTSRGNTFFLTGASYTTSFNQSDLYSYVNAVIQENAEYDYIEYYPTWNGQFLADYINLLNDAGGDWVVINQLDLYEQLGINFVKTFSMSSLQETAFDAPAAFRPIVRNAALAISYSIDYTMRLMNRINGQEIVRKATFASTDPKKYGPSLQRINVLEGFTPVKVYNKIINTSSETIANSVQYVGSPTVLTQNVYVNSYYDLNYISVDSTTDMSVILGQFVYPQGTNYIFINKFDNYVKFKVFTKSPDKQQNITLDFSITGMNAKLAFIMDDGSKTFISPTQDLTIANPGAGELLFLIDSTLSTKLLGGTQRDYFLVNQNPDGTETMIYSGHFADVKDKTQILANVTSVLFNQINNTITAVNTAQQNIASGISSATGTAGATGTNNGSASNVSLAASQAAQISQSQASLSPASAGANGIQNAISNVANTSANAAGSTNNASSLNIVSVPGVTPSLGSSINNTASPNVITPSDPTSILSYSSLAASAFQQIKDKLNKSIT